MSEFKINKGIGRTVELYGLKAQYLFVFAGGLLAALILVMVLYMAGLSPYACIGTGAVSCTLIVWQTFRLNKTYGQYGVMKLAARKKHPKYILSRKAVFRYFQSTQKS
ncbi:DUF4133 domain-containing protein [Chryseobacterium sp. CKR4-1]|uniref:DUF4133 domain-containing protein n=1 Tax=Chryseobacterium sp. CKR4-1 TaxID=3068896 RepID=UPI0027965965|nr:DUF4133 domain-containing protein [Chryseobacterium sp. CKR4-1]MDQ1803081.1 DUF4133 domain-containing protein [Chryseobacterium sp. CKR4-1]